MLASRPAEASPPNEDRAALQAEPCPISSTTSEEHFVMSEPPSHRHPFHETPCQDYPAFHRRNAGFARKTRLSSQPRRSQPIIFPPPLFPRRFTILRLTSRSLRKSVGKPKLFAALGSQDSLYCLSAHEIY